MGVEYTNRSGKKYFLHVGKTKTGKPRYYFSLKKKGTLADDIPEGFEVYEHPESAVVFLRKEVPRLITDLEKKTVERELKKLSSSKWYLIDIKGKDLTIYESREDIDRLKAIFGSKVRPHDDLSMDDILGIAVSYTPIMKYILQDEDKRTFTVMRCCLLGSIDDWIQIGGSSRLKDLVETFTKRLGDDTLFDLF